MVGKDNDVPDPVGGGCHGGGEHLVIESAPGGQLIP